MVRSSYDKSHDIFYLAIGDFRSDEEEPISAGVYLGYAVEDSQTPKGATIFRFAKRAARERADLIRELARALGVREDDIERAFREAI